MEVERGKRDVSLESNSLRKVTTLGTPKEWVNRSLITKGVDEFSLHAPSSHLLSDLLILAMIALQLKHQDKALGNRWLKGNKKQQKN